ncbi:unnamed protein product [Rotaria sp. Silwood1]|nr:unnamed protein product [Rotaria sp. Silwood1]CAF3509824.1 unnamed protein product [Rotaria sp. Silwood1]CAF4532468.1 unnamed protein product [Rotaria sp. Silwood1]
MSASNNIMYMIINADDFGYCPKRDKAIIDLFKQKSISSTSLLVNGDNSYQACLYAKQYNLPMGIHFNLTEGRPITNDLSKIKSLVNSNGIMHGKFGLRYELDQGNIEEKHIEYELINQLNKYKELTNNQLPIHIDGHQHIHIHPMIVEIIAQIAKQYEIKYIRTPYDQMIINYDIDNLFYKNIIYQTKLAMKIFNKYSLKYTKYFFGITIMGKEFTLNNIEKCFQLFKNISNEKNKCILIEFMCHPGYPSNPYIGGCV